MKIYVAVLFVIAATVLVIQAAHIGYLKWFEPRTSVLDRYADGGRGDEYVPRPGSLEELLKEYETLYQRVGKYRTRKEIPDGPDREQIVEDLDKLGALGAAIEGWERRAALLAEMRFHWLCGILVALAGALCARRVSLLLGMPFLIGGFIEMIAYTHSFSTRDHSGISEMLLTYRLVLSIITLILLIGNAYFLRLFTIEEELSMRGRYL